MANVPQVSWSETSPAGSDNISQGDNRIREFKTQVREVFGVDHDFPSSGQATDNGQHLKVTLQEQADLGTGAVGTTILGNQTVSGVGELVYTTEADADIQITSVGGINAAAMTGVYAAANVAAIATIAALIYPVGSIYANASDSTNPATLLGFGTWSAIEEQYLAGYKSGGTFDPVGALAEGEETHVLTEAELPAHTHTVTIGNQNDSSTTYAEGQSVNGGTFNTGSVGSGTAHNNLPPAYVCYIWRRTA